MLSCREATKLCCQALDGRLNVLEQASLNAHLMTCSGCTNFDKQIRLFRDAVPVCSHSHVDWSLERVPSAVPTED